MIAAPDRPTVHDAPAHVGEATPPSARRASIRSWLLVGAAVAVAAAVVGHQQALGDLRTIEATYVSGRKVTACTIARLNPSAGEAELARLDETLQVLVTDAHGRAQAVRTDLRGIRTGPLPHVRSAHARVDDAIDAQVALYAVLSTGSGDGEREVQELGRRNASAERSLSRLRSVLLVGEGTGWGDRLNCGRGFVDGDE